MTNAPFVSCEWVGRKRLYHATAGGQFEQFDFKRSSGCVWFVSDREDARKMALSFAIWRSPFSAYVYECDVLFSRLASFRNEGGVYALAREQGTRGGVAEKSTASSALLQAGFDGIIDNYDGEMAPSFASLCPENVEIVRGVAVA